MSTASPTTIAAALERELRKQWRDPTATVELLDPFGDGHSAFTYSAVISRTSETATYVLRLSPPNARIAGPADIGRQARVMIALGLADLPVPGVHAFSSAPAIDGRSFALMDLVEGGDWKQAAAATSHRQVAAAAVSVLRRMHDLAPARTGISDDLSVSPHDELGRWARLLERAPQALQIRAARFHEALEMNAPPPTPGPVLVHGDYHYGNLLFRDGEVVAVLDWEIASLGEPLLDVACLLVATMRERYAPEPNPTGSVAIPPAEVLMMFEVQPAYAAWYVALTCFKYAAILGYNFELHRAGKRPDPIYDELQVTMFGLLQDGARVLHEGLDGY
jgi:aminoglycoside phosphotransferase (APT) family kinase protein